MSKTTTPPPVCEVDPSVSRQEIEGFQFALGTYPVETMKPVPGFSEDFEQADGADTEGDWEEWPDRYVYDVVISADRLPALCRALYALLPARVYPILDVLGQDAYREIDPYISYELVGLDRFLDSIRRYRAYLFEDGMCGFGAMCDDPFFYVFVDEHKIVTVRSEVTHKERIEQIFAAFDLAPVAEPAGADAAAHEHRGVLLLSAERPELMSPDEVIERLLDEWRLTLNVDTESNLDDDGRELGLCGWRCVVRHEHADRTAYAEVLLGADSYADAEDLALEAVADLATSEDDEDMQLLLRADRVTATSLAALLGQPEAENPTEAGIIRVRWVE